MLSFDDRIRAGIERRRLGPSATETVRAARDSRLYAEAEMLRLEIQSLLDRLRGSDVFSRVFSPSATIDRSRRGESVLFRVVGRACELEFEYDGPTAIVLVGQVAFSIHPSFDVQRTYASVQYPYAPDSPVRGGYDDLATVMVAAEEQLVEFCADLAMSSLARRFGLERIAGGEGA